MNEKLNEEMVNLLKLMQKEGPGSDMYETYSKRLSELQALQLAERKMALEERKFKDEARSRKLDQALTKESNDLRNVISKRDCRTEYGRTALGGFIVAGTIFLTQIVEQNEIIRSRGWSYISKLIPRF